MSAIAIVDQAYPFIYVHFQGASTLEDTHNFLARFDEWLLRQESFSILLRQTEIEKESVPTEEHHEVHRLIAQWAKQHKLQIANYCVGMAMVIDSPEAFEVEKRKIPRMISGCLAVLGKPFKIKNLPKSGLKIC